MQEFSISIPFVKSIFGIIFGFTILFNIYCIICVAISDDGIKKINIPIMKIDNFCIFIFNIALILIDIINVNTIFANTKSFALSFLLTFFFLKFNFSYISSIPFPIK